MTEMDPFDASIRSEIATLRAEVAKWQAMVGVGTKEDAAEIAALRASRDAALARVSQVERERDNALDSSKAWRKAHDDRERESDARQEECSKQAERATAALARVGVLEAAARAVVETAHEIELAAPDGHGWFPLVVKDRYIDALRAALSSPPPHATGCCAAGGHTGGREHDPYCDQPDKPPPHDGEGA